MLDTYLTAWGSLMWAAIWQSALLFGLVLLACKVFPQIPSRVRATLWWLVSAKLVLGLVFASGIPLKVLPHERSELAFLNQRLDLMAPEIKAPAKVDDYLVDVTNYRPEPEVQAGVSYLVILFGLWALGSASILAVLIVQSFRAAALVKRATPLHNALASEARQIGVEMGLNRAPKLYESVEVTSPMVLGLTRPKVLLPEGCCKKLSTEEARMSLAHELAHIRRWDLPLGLVPTLAQTFFFFLPTVWIVGRKWETEREAACDALALEITKSSPAEYGRMLMKIVVKDFRGALSNALGATAQYHTLKERLLRMKLHPTISPRLRLPSILLLSAGLLLVLPWQIAAQDASGPRNVVRNGGFEDGGASNWSRGSLPPDTDVPVSITVDSTGKNGKASLKFEKSENRLFPVAMMAQQIPYDGKAQKLKVGAWIKSKGVRKFAVGVIMDGYTEWGPYVGDANSRYEVDHDWKYYTCVIAVRPNTRAITLSLQMYSPGTIWIDDISAQYVPDDTPAKAPLVQDSDEDPEADIKDVANESKTVAGDPKMRYFMIGKGKSEPAEGYKLLLVMPGGDGSADFNPFIRRIWKGALPSGYIVCQLVAPKWSDDQFSQIVWPTNKKRWATMKFSTEQFLEAVIADVKKVAKIDPKHVYTLSWSSGGPAAYAAALSSNSIKGSFIAMSIYRPEDLPSPSGAKGRGFYLLHSPTDFIQIAQPRKAVDELGKAGAKITLDTYEGGHGWKGDVFGMIRKGVEWLEKNSGG